MAPSALSENIKQLEHAVGVKLFDRTTRRVELTDAGRNYAVDVDRVIEAFDGALERVRKIRTLERGRVTIGAIPSALSGIVLPSVKRFASDHPEIKIRLIEARGLALSHAVRDGQFDFGIGGMYRAISGVDARPLLMDRLGLIAPSTAPLLSRRAITWQALKPYRFVGLENDTVTQAMATEIANAPEAVRQPQYVVANNWLLADMVNAGLGLAVLSAMSSCHPALSPLVFRPLTSPSVERRIMLQTRAGYSLSPAAAWLQVELVAEVAKFVANAKGLRLLG